MPRKPRVRALTDSQHIKGSERLHKSAQQYFCHVFYHSERKSAPKKFF